MALPSFLSARRPSAFETTRGSGILTAADARRYGHDGGGPVFHILDAPIPEPLRYRTLVIQGHQGTGKTLTILLSLLQVLERMRNPSNPERLIIVDAKGDVTSSVLGLARVVCPGVPIFLLNPFDLF